MKLTAKRLSLTAAALLLASTSLAHHSLAPFDIRNPIEVTGVAEKFVFRRPHPMLNLVDTDGVDWIIEVPVRHWQRNEVPTDAIKAGDELVVLLFPARNGSPEGAMSGFTKNGQFVSVAESIGQREANAAADAIEQGMSAREAVEANLKPGENYETAGVHSAGPTPTAPEAQNTTEAVAADGDSSMTAWMAGAAVVVAAALGLVAFRRR